MYDCFIENERLPSGTLCFARCHFEKSQQVLIEAMHINYILMSFMTFIAYIFLCAIFEDHSHVLQPPLHSSLSPSTTRTTGHEQISHFYEPNLSQTGPSYHEASAWNLYSKQILQIQLVALI